MKFHGGTFLGRRFETNEILVAMADGKVVKARDFREIPDEGAWKPEALKNIIGTPWCATGTVPLQFPSEDENSFKLPEVEPADGTEPQARGLSLRPRHFQKIGWTPDCPKCRSLQRGD